MAKESKPATPRDDAEEQPESGYPGGRMSTKPSADPRAKDKQARQTGSESEFDSSKRRPSGSGQPS